MAATFACPACHQTIAAEGATGTQVQCPLCHNVVTVPAQTPPPMVESAAPTPYGGRPPGQVSSGMAVGSLICGLSGLIGCVPVGLVGVVLGIVAVVRANSQPQRYRGKGMAIAGICLGAVSLIFITPLMISILLPSLSRARELSKRLVCGAQLRGIGTSVKIYAMGWEDQFPPDFDVLVNSGEVTVRQFCCPSSDAVPGDVHACYEYVEGQTEGDDFRNVLVYEKSANHADEGGNVLFLDGHVDFVRPYSRIEELVAETKRRMAETRERQAGDRTGP